MPFIWLNIMPVLIGVAANVNIFLSLWPTNITDANTKAPKITQTITMICDSVTCFCGFFMVLHLLKT